MFYSTDSTYLIWFTHYQWWRSCLSLLWIESNGTHVSNNVCVLGLKVIHVVHGTVSEEWVATAKSEEATYGPVLRMVMNQGLRAIPISATEVHEKRSLRFCIIFAVASYCILLLYHIVGVFLSWWQSRLLNPGGGST